MIPTRPYPIQPHFTPSKLTPPHPTHVKASQTLQTQGGWRNTRYCYCYGDRKETTRDWLTSCTKYFSGPSTCWTPHLASFGTTWIKLIPKLVSKQSKPKALGALLRGGALTLFCQERSWNLRVLCHLESQGQFWSESIKRKLYKYIISIRTQPVHSRKDDL